MTNPTDNDPLSPEARAELTAAVKILREDRIMAHMRAASKPAEPAKVDPPVKPADPAKPPKPADPAPIEPPPVVPPVETPKKKGLWWGDQLPDGDDK